jgi:uncharacterized OsmC-like protein
MSITSKIIYQGNLRTEAEHVKSGHQIVTDAPTDNQGKGESFSPTDMVATALGSCMLTIMGIKARDKDIDITGTTIETIKTMASNPRRISKIDIKMIMPAKNYTDRDKKILIAASNACPVHGSLHPDMEINVNVIWS